MQAGEVLKTEGVRCYRLDEMEQKVREEEAERVSRAGSGLS